MRGRSRGVTPATGMERRSSRPRLPGGLVSVSWRRRAAAIASRSSGATWRTVWRRESDGILLVNGARSGTARYGRHDATSQPLAFERAGAVWAAPHPVRLWRSDPDQPSRDGLG